MKKSTFLTALCLLVSSCTLTIAPTDTLDNSASLTPITVTVSGFSVEQSPFTSTRATPVSDCENIKFLTLAFYNKTDGTEVYKHTQQKGNLSSNETFGDFSTSLAIGNYTMVVIANEGSNAISLTSPTSATYGTNTVKDTFVATQEVNVTGGAAMTLTATLSRMVAAVAVQSTDKRPATITQVRFTYSAGGKSFNPTTGLATSNDGFGSLMQYKENANTTTYAGGYLFLASDEQTMTVKIETLDAEGTVVFSKEIADVPLKRNRTTKLTGAIYSDVNVSSGSFQINTSWLNNHDIDF